MAYSTKPPRGTAVNLNHPIVSGMQCCIHFYPTVGCVDLMGNFIGADHGTKTYNSFADGGVMSGGSDSNYWSMADLGQKCDPGGNPCTIQFDILPLIADNGRNGGGACPVNRGAYINDGWNLQIISSVFQMEINDVPSGSGGTGDQIIYWPPTDFPCFTTGASVDGPFRRGTLVLNGAGTYPQGYVDGVAVTTTMIGENGANNVNQITIKQNIARTIQIGNLTNYAPNYFYAGYISRFIYWNRALTAGEISQVGHPTNYDLAYCYMKPPVQRMGGRCM